MLLCCSQILTMTEPFTYGFTHEIINGWTWWWYCWWWQQISSKFQCEVEYIRQAKSSQIWTPWTDSEKPLVQTLFGFRKQNLSPAVITGSTALSPAKQSPELPAWVQTAPACRTSGDVSRSGSREEVTAHYILLMAGWRISQNAIKPKLLCKSKASLPNAKIE